MTLTEKVLTALITARTKSLATHHTLALGVQFRMQLAVPRLTQYSACGARFGLDRDVLTAVRTCFRPV